MPYSSIKKVICDAWRFDYGGEGDDDDSCVSNWRAHMLEARTFVDLPYLICSAMLHDAPLSVRTTGHSIHFVPFDGKDGTRPDQPLLPFGFRLALDHPTHYMVEGVVLPTESQEWATPTTSGEELTLQQLVPSKTPTPWTRMQVAELVFAAPLVRRVVGIDRSAPGSVSSRDVLSTCTCRDMRPPSETCATRLEECGGYTEPARSTRSRRLSYATEWRRSITT